MMAVTYPDEERSEVVVPAIGFEGRSRRGRAVMVEAKDFLWWVPRAVIVEIKGNGDGG